MLDKSEIIIYNISCVYIYTNDYYDGGQPRDQCFEQGASYGWV